GKARVDFAVERADDLGRRIGWRSDAAPRARFVIGQKIRNHWQVGQDVLSRAAADGKRAQCPGLETNERCRPLARTRSAEMYASRRLSGQTGSVSNATNGRNSAVQQAAAAPCDVLTFGRAQEGVHSPRLDSEVSALT